MCFSDRGIIGEYSGMPNSVLAGVALIDFLNYASHIYVGKAKCYIELRVKVELCQVHGTVQLEKKLTLHNIIKAKEKIKQGVEKMHHDLKGKDLY